MVFGVSITSPTSLYGPWVARPCLSMPPLVCTWCGSYVFFVRRVTRLPGDQWMRQSRRMGIELPELGILTASAKLAWFFLVDIYWPTFFADSGAGWGSSQKQFGETAGLVHFAAVLFRKGCVLVDFFLTCSALGLRCLSCRDVEVKTPDSVKYHKERNVCHKWII